MDAVAFGTMPFARIDDEAIPPALADFCAPAEPDVSDENGEMQLGPTLDDGCGVCDDDAIPLNCLWLHPFSISKLKDTCTMWVVGAYF